MVQRANKRRYELLIKGVSTCQYLGGLFAEEVDKIVSILLNQVEINCVEEDDSLNSSQYKKSLFIVVDGEYGEYNRSLDNKTKGDALRIYRGGQTFGSEVLVNREK